MYIFGSSLCLVSALLYRIGSAVCVIICFGYSLLMSGKEKLADFREACFDDSNMSKEVITIETLIAMLMEMNVDVSQEVL